MVAIEVHNIVQSENGCILEYGLVDKCLSF